MMLLDMCMDVLLQDEINIIKLLYMHIEKNILWHCIKIMLIDWIFLYHNRFKYPLVDLVKISYSLVGRAVALGTEGSRFDPSL